MKKRAYSIDSIFVLVLFAVFAITVLFVLMSGAGVYKDTQSLMTERYQERTAISYLVAKVNHYDSENSVYVTKVQGTQALACCEEMNGVSYTTYIYCDGSQIKEIMVETGMEFDPADGLDIIEAKALQLEKKDNLIKIACTGLNGTTSYATIHVESGIGGDSVES